MSKHSIVWADGGSAQIECEDNRDLDQIITAEGYKMGSKEPDICNACGGKVRLIWDVRVEDLSS